METKLKDEEGDRADIGQPVINSESNDHQEGDIEDGLITERKQTNRRPNWKDLWRTIFLGNHRREVSNMGYQDVPDEEALLQDLNTPALMRKNSWNGCCVFGLLSGLMIIAVLLIVALVKILTSSHTDDPPQNWGKPGTGTESLDWYPTDLTRDITPIPCYSHNDYWHKVPVYSAILTGCTGIEADVHLINGELYVGHNEAGLSKSRTFRNLYIEPLVRILEQQNGKKDFWNATIEGIFEQHPARSLVFLIDLKSDGEATWPEVSRQLQPLRARGWLSFVENGKINRRPITVVGGGKAPYDLVTANSTYRDTFFDAPLDIMGQVSSDPNEIRYDKYNTYMASTSFRAAVGKISGGKLSQKQLDIIRSQLKGAHKRGLKARYWETPDWPVSIRNYVWDVLIKEGVDFLNVDDLRAVLGVF